MYRASILDITDPTYYKMFEVFSEVESFYLDSGDLNATWPDFGFCTVNDGQTIHTWSTTSGLEFNFTSELTSPALLNGGLGNFLVGSRSIYEWGTPACKTTGSFTINGSTVEIDSENSLTWFDRQCHGE
jgi:kievitone hydratase